MHVHSVSYATKHGSLLKKKYLLTYFSVILFVSDSSFDRRLIKRLLCKHSICLMKKMDALDHIGRPKTRMYIKML